MLYKIIFHLLVSRGLLSLSAPVISHVFPFFTAQLRAELDFFHTVTSLRVIGTKCNKRPFLIFGSGHQQHCLHRSGGNVNRKNKARFMENISRLQTFVSVARISHCSFLLPWLYKATLTPDTGGENYYCSLKASVRSNLEVLFIAQ